MKLKIGENIREYRRKMNLTQQQFAEKLGVTYQSVSRWEIGETYPDMELLPAIAEIFSVTVDQLMGVPEMEKERQAIQCYDDLRRECLKETVDTERVTSLLREIRRNHLNSTEAWRPWCEGNDRAFRLPEVLPEVRLTAEAYLEIHPRSPHVLQTMAAIEDEDRLEAFLNQYTNPYDISWRALLFDRYLRNGNGEKLEPERRYRLYDAFDRILTRSVLMGLDRDEKNVDAKTLFQSRILDVIRDGGSKDVPDIWTGDRLWLGIERASILARGGKPEEALAELADVTSLLENTMKIRDTQLLSTSCRWLEGMEWRAEETWYGKRNDPDEPEERGIRIHTEMSGMITCNAVYPSTVYADMANLKGNECLQATPEYQAILARVKALIERRRKAE